MTGKRVRSRPHWKSKISIAKRPMWARRSSALIFDGMNGIKNIAALIVAGLGALSSRTPAKCCRIWSSPRMAASSLFEADWFLIAFPLIDCNSPDNGEAPVLNHNRCEISHDTEFENFLIPPSENPWKRTGDGPFTSLATPRAISCTFCCWMLLLLRLFENVILSGENRYLRTAALNLICFTTF